MSPVKAFIQLCAAVIVLAAIISFTLVYLGLTR